MTDQFLLSTKDVAGLLNVAETTIKRWAGEQTLPCVKTAGGHRKFPMHEVLAFADHHRYPVTGLIPPSMTQRQGTQLQRGVQTHHYALLARIFLEETLQGDHSGLYELLAYVYKHQIPFSRIADDIIRPAMQEIGKHWSENRLEVNHEHRASQAVFEALVRFGPEMHRKPLNGLSAVCSCGEGELHSIGLQCVAYGLETEGWTVSMLGANTPFDSLRSFIKRVRPNLVCLSSTIERKKRELSDAVHSVARTVHAYHGVLVLGGGVIHHIPKDDFGCDFTARSLQETLSFTRDHFQLKPGPKKPVTSIGQKG